MRPVPKIAPRPNSPRRSSSQTDAVNSRPVPTLSRWPGFQGLMSQMESRLSDPKPRFRPVEVAGDVLRSTYASAADENEV